MVCRLRLTRQSWQPEVHKLTPPSSDPTWRFAPAIQKLSVPFLGPGFLDESGTLESKTLKRGARQASLLQGWPRWQQAAVVKHILRMIGDLEHQYYLSFIFLANNFKVSERMYILQLGRHECGRVCDSSEEMIGLFTGFCIRVAKCQYFYTEQNCQAKFYPKKNA